MQMINALVKTHHENNNNNNRLLGSCSHKTGLENVTYAYMYYKIPTIHNNSHIQPKMFVVSYMLIR